MSNNPLKNLLSIGTSAIRFNLQKWRRRKPAYFNKSDDVNKHLNNLRTDGYSIVENFFTQEQCSILRNHIDQAIEKYPDAIWSGYMGADKRIFGAEHLLGDFQKYYSDDFIHQVGSRYFGGLLENLQTLAGKISAVEGNLGSGEGWHRDGNNFQFKSLIYLSDANLENGPFQLIRNSQRLRQILKDSATLNLEDPLKTRFTDTQIDILLTLDPSRLITLTAPAGTMVLLDVSAIHRGSPIRMGHRYSMFNYFYPSYDVAGRIEKFLPRLKPSMVNSEV